MSCHNFQETENKSHLEVNMKTERIERFIFASSSKTTLRVEKQITVTTTMTPQTRRCDMVGWMSYNNNRAAPCSTCLGAILWVALVWPITTQNFQFEVLTITWARSGKCFIFCLYMKTTCYIPAKGHFSNLGQYGQQWIIAKHLTYRKFSLPFNSRRGLF